MFSHSVFLKNLTTTAVSLFLLSSLFSPSAYGMKEEEKGNVPIKPSFIKSPSLKLTTQGKREKIARLIRLEQERRQQPVAYLDTVKKGRGRHYIVKMTTDTGEQLVETRINKN
jgi:hypothetical protein